MRKGVLSFLLIISLLMVPVDIYASEAIVRVDGVGLGSGTYTYFSYAESDDSYYSYVMYEIPRSVIDNGYYMYLLNPKNVTLIYQMVATPQEDLGDFLESKRPTSGSSTFTNVVSGTSRGDRFTFQTDSIIDLSTYDYDTSLNYYLFCFDNYRSFDADTGLIGDSISLYISESEYTGESSPDPSPSPSPSPVISPTPVPTSPPEIKKSVIVDSWQVEEGETLDVGKTFNVFPYSVELGESTTVLGEYYRDGNTYIMHYKFSLPSRFVYSGHVGTAYSTPQVVLDMDINYGISTDGIINYFGTNNVYTSSDIAFDRLNTFPENKSDQTISGLAGYSFINVPIMDSVSLNSYELCFEWDLIVTDLNNPLVFTDSFAYQCELVLNNIQYVADYDFSHVSDELSSSILEKIEDNTFDIFEEQKRQDQVERDTANEAVEAVDLGVKEVTGVLSSWEIFTMPVTLVTDFAEAIAADGSTGLTFPSFSLMGHEIWPSYTFDLQVINEKFPVLMDSLHIISGILIVIAFVRYLWRKWSILTGDDLPEGEGK